MTLVFPWARQRPCAGSACSRLLSVSRWGCLGFLVAGSASCRPGDSSLWAPLWVWTSLRRRFPAVPCGETEDQLSEPRQVHAPCVPPLAGQETCPLGHRPPLGPAGHSLPTGPARRPCSASCGIGHLFPRRRLWWWPPGGCVVRGVPTWLVRVLWTGAGVRSRFGQCHVQLPGTSAQTLLGTRVSVFSLRGAAEEGGRRI